MYSKSKKDFKEYLVRILEGSREGMGRPFKRLKKIQEKKLSSHRIISIHIKKEKIDTYN